MRKRSDAGQSESGHFYQFQPCTRKFSLPIVSLSKNRVHESLPVLNADDIVMDDQSMIHCLASWSPQKVALSSFDVRSPNHYNLRKPRPPSDLHPYPTKPISVRQKTTV